MNVRSASRRYEFMTTGLENVGVYARQRRTQASTQRKNEPLQKKRWLDMPPEQWVVPHMMSCASEMLRGASHVLGKWSTGKFNCDDSNESTLGGVWVFVGVVWNSRC